MFTLCRCVPFGTTDGECSYLWRPDTQRWHLGMAGSNDLSQRDLISFYLLVLKVQCVLGFVWSVWYVGHMDNCQWKISVRDGVKFPFFGKTNLIWSSMPYEDDWTVQHSSVPRSADQIAGVTWSISWYWSKLAIMVNNMAPHLATRHFQHLFLLPGFLHCTWSICTPGHFVCQLGGSNASDVENVDPTLRIFDRRSLGR